MKLKYEFTAKGVMVYLWEGEVWADRKIVTEQEFLLAELPDILQGRDETQEYSIAGYGLAKLLQDRTSQVEGASNKLDAMVDYFNIFKQGKWREYAERTGGTGRVDPVLAAAIAKLKKVDILTATNALKAKSADERKALASLPAVAEAIAKMKAQATDGLDLSDLE